MTISDKSILLVGSVPCETAQDVYNLLGPGLGNQLAGLPHGEPGYRNMWVVFNAPHVYEPNPGIIITNKPKPDRDKTVFKDVPDWLPTNWEEMWQCAVREDVDEIHFDSLYYADYAVECYQDFRALREQEVIPEGTRYQVNFPFPEDFTRWCTGNPRDFSIMTRAIVDVLGREVEVLLREIPHDDLNIQWDVCWEVFACDTGDYMGREPLAWKADGDPYERFADYMRALSPPIPEEVMLGMHLCYGDLEHSHLIEPRDLGVCVKMTNIAVENAGRRLDYVHMPVPRDRSDDAYFEPLAALEAPDTTIYIGLVHLTDGLEGGKERLEAFLRHYNGGYGIATECGWGRRKRETIPDLMQVHRDIVGTVG